MARKLTEKERLFIKYYLISWNATGAAIEAGYSKKSAANIGWENVRKPHIIKVIDRKKRKLADKLNIRKEDLIFDLISVTKSAKQNAHVDQKWSSTYKGLVERLCNMLGFDVPQELKNTLIIKEKDLKKLKHSKLDDKIKNVRKRKKGKVSTSK